MSPQTATFRTNEIIQLLCLCKRKIHAFYMKPLVAGIARYHHLSIIWLATYTVNGFLRIIQLAVWKKIIPTFTLSHWNGVRVRCWKPE